MAALLYFLIVIGFAIMLVIITTGCDPIEPNPTATPTSKYVTDWKHPFDKVERVPEPCRCRPRATPFSEDPRLLP